MEQTLSIIKPDGTARKLIPAIYLRFQQAGLHIIAAKMLQLSVEQAEHFYAVHRKQPFFHGLIESMTSGPVMVQVLAGHDAIRRHRELMGATDPKKAVSGSLRADFAKSIDENTVHGSDSAETAKQEISFFFQEHELCNLP